MAETLNACSVDIHVELKIVTQKTHTFASHLNLIEISYRDRTCALLFVHVMVIVCRCQTIASACRLRGIYYIYISICKMN